MIDYLSRKKTTGGILRFDDTTQPGKRPVCRCHSSVCAAGVEGARSLMLLIISMNYMLGTETDLMGKAYVGRSKPEEGEAPTGAR